MALIWALSLFMFVINIYLLFSSYMKSGRVMLIVVSLYAIVSLLTTVLLESIYTIAFASTPPSLKTKGFVINVNLFVIFKIRLMTGSCSL